MYNKNNKSDDSKKKEIENKNIIVKNIVNYYPKVCLTYFGRKNHTLFFGWRNNNFELIQQIVIQQQFSLNRQSKVIKKWRVDFKEIAFMNKSHEFIALCKNEIQNWKIDCCYNLTKSISFNFHDIDEHQDYHYDDSFQLQLGTKDDWIVVGQYRKILFLQKGMEGEWKLIHTMEIQFLEFKLNESGKILIILWKECLLTNEQLYLTIYIKNNIGEWSYAKEMNHGYYCFLDNEQFVDINYDKMITIWQVKPQKLEVVQLQQLKLNLKKGQQLQGINYMKQNQLLIVQSRFAVYFIKKKNEKFYFAQCIEIQSELLVASSEGFLFNIFRSFSYGKARPQRIEILKVHEN